MDCINPVKDRKKRLAFVSTAVSVQCEAFDEMGTVRFFRRTLLHAIRQSVNQSISSFYESNKTLI